MMNALCLKDFIDRTHLDNHMVHIVDKDILEFTNGQNKCILNVRTGTYTIHGDISDMHCDSYEFL